MAYKFIKKDVVLYLRLVYVPVFIIRLYIITCVMVFTFVGRVQQRSRSENKHSVDN